ncbi:hypothetical protein [Pseudoroseomonas cervicalis]|uniref:hypothetical protein n=1 Tax=Teichococcus cervicalis TaxID=204525 RepID=UPI002783D37E|nr:hypothetical protein [Pseudoroseomonas cervicalis]MDQ1077905.1 hypothetical protein [Pseudoroseomonas cervicalis]
MAMALGGIEKSDEGPSPRRKRPARLAGPEHSGYTLPAGLETGKICAKTIRKSDSPCPP